MSKSKISMEVIGIIIALATLVVAILTWLVPFNPVGTSPFTSRETLQVVATATTSVLSNNNTTFVFEDDFNSYTWQLNPVLPQPQGFTGWISSKDPRDFESGVWTQGVNVSINENQLLLVFGGLAKLPAIGEIGTRTSCFVIASRGPLNLSLDLMSARLEVHNVDVNATSLAWAAQKVKVMQEVYPSTCGKGLDIAVGK